MFSLVSFIIACVANVLLSLVVLANNSKALLNRIFFMLSILLPVWITVLYLEDTHPDTTILNLLVRSDYLLATLMAASFYWFCLLLSKYEVRWISRFVIGSTILASLLALVGLLAAPEYVGGDLVLSPGPAYDLFMIHLLSATLAGLGYLVHGVRKQRGRVRAQIEIIGLGVFLTIAIFLLTSVIVPRVFGIADPGITRLSMLGALAFTGFCSYAIVRHRFLSVRLLVARTLAYVLLLVTMATLYGAIGFGASNLLFPESTISTLQTVFNTALAVILALTFQPLRNFFQRFTNRIFFRDQYDSQDLLNGIGKVLVEEFKLEPLLRKILYEICRELKISSGQFYVFNDHRVYKVEHYGAVPQKMMTVPHLEQLRHRLEIADELPDGKHKTLLEQHGVRVAMHLRTREEFVGYLLLGDKLNGDIYSSQDIEVLQILGQELAVAISNSKAYEEIERFNDTLQGKVDDATKRLRQANTHLKELDQAKDEFISMASHQLRTPLTTIKGYLSMLQEGDAGKLSHDQLEFITYAYGGAQRMVNLISDLLNVSRMSAGKFLIEKMPLNLTQVVSEEVQQLQTHAQSKDLKLEFVKPSKALPSVSLDENKTRQVIMNFIDNALYYTKEGGVTVTLEKVGGALELRVKDTGIGVPKVAQKKLFTKFYRAENAQTVRPDGTGLGLFLAKRVIEDQGGTIIFESEEGHGSTFGFSLPLIVK
jgi:signal transduction histidine kinase